MSKPTDRVIRIPAEAHEALREIAAEDRRSMAQQIAWLILGERARREKTATK